jgi:hypothetical protein
METTTENLIKEFGGYEVEEKKKPQWARILDLLSDNEPHTVSEIIEKCYGINHAGYCNVHGRITDLRKMGYKIPEAKRVSDTIYTYQLMN